MSDNNTLKFIEKYTNRKITRKMEFIKDVAYIGGNSMLVEVFQELLIDLLSGQFEFTSDNTKDIKKQEQDETKATLIAEKNIFHNNTMLVTWEPDNMLKWIYSDVSGTEIDKNLTRDIVFCYKDLLEKYMDKDKELRNYLGTNEVLNKMFMLLVLIDVEYLVLLNNNDRNPLPRIFYKYYFIFKQELPLFVNNRFADKNGNLPFALSNKAIVLQNKEIPDKESFYQLMTDINNKSSMSFLLDA